MVVPFWTPITPLTGSLLHADPQPGVVEIHADRWAQRDQRRDWLSRGKRLDHRRICARPVQQQPHSESHHTGRQFGSDPWQAKRTADHWCDIWPSHLTRQNAAQHHRDFDDYMFRASSTIQINIRTASSDKCCAPTASYLSRACGRWNQLGNANKAKTCENRAVDARQMRRNQLARRKSADLMATRVLLPRMSSSIQIR